ncbi:mitochondrial import inner membrane translocase subunit Tim29-like isoform X2 [Pollicipes pollicipes]|uniref:mitochondrial import inner membrane translocase subunit Tim29-like isoform X2 n=1 Tax=Pollicipes pollicipes TaxID=41117 RepID=UPI0018857B3E|nr:mitochondrial import inner membrane translocase subunit Tim29-like isoform X2 [Pollicipes pollicipes]XP_037092322.1 mitochondrial import inner membrane translocase subunit Tim29-like isoform X2 [Pollicipes pollicipes]XP_037092323.1 mitochondrial import inner membrane translocase subunit Tim29-like isoform X2 [Pollicipes pollicipes]
MSGLLTRFRNGPLSRWGAYWRQLGQDYAEVFRDTAKDARNRPVKSAIYALGTSALVYGWNTSPGERQFSDQLLAADGRLRLLAPAQRSPAAERHVRRLRQLQADGRLRAQNLGPLSLLWELEYPAGTALHAAQCSHLRPSYLSFHERVRDVGAAGRWWGLWRRMRDYDVNEDVYQDADAVKALVETTAVGGPSVS